MRDVPYSYPPARPRRLWLILPVVTLVVLALAWCGLWYFAAGQAESEIAAWREGEAQRGRVITCASQEIGGFPFRIEVSCAEPSVAFRDPQLPALKAKNALAAVQIYQPNLLIAEISGPLAVTQASGTAIASIGWRDAQVSVRGLMPPPERVSAVFDKITADRLDAGAPERLAAAEHLELHVRQAPRLPADPPAFDLGLRLSGATVPQVPQLASAPLNADISAVLRGVDDLSPKPLAQRLREFQAAGGRLDIRQARVSQGEVVAVGQGTLRLTAAGRLDGELNLTVAGLDQLVTALGLDQAVARQTQGAANRLAPGLNLEKLLGSRGNAALAAAGVAMLGRPAELEGRKAVTLPLRFADGQVFFGPLMVGQMQPLF
ncbi:DUF2125 domain-containing protein [Xanthobacteraceae bacterium Astr-EGSB]|uniref:DUF2125 domain-containing protein n=1 Tax=Astrobacterium formosum TaxID=3069710 RepID=UPI0027B3B77E|nr:DUF2125 domain-containing protein [Xanthobacteraceae bacterium Astr-EGSB]